MNIFRNNIVFMDQIPKNININKTNKSFYFKSFMLQPDIIFKFINSLPENEVFLVNAFISRYDLSSDPYLVLSKHFFITNETDALMIVKYLNKQLVKAEEDLRVEFIENSYHLIFKCKIIWFEENKI